jgi:hypothetical protein
MVILGKYLLKEKEMIMIYDSKTKDMQIILRNELQQAKLMRKHKKDLEKDWKQG